MSRYPAPFGSDFRISPVLLEPTLTADNYRARMHDLLCVEEIAQYAIISRSGAQCSFSLQIIIIVITAIVISLWWHNVKRLLGHVT